MKEEISIKSIFDIIKSRIIIIISATLVTACIAAVITHFYITPMYTSSIGFCVRSSVVLTEQSSSSDRNEVLYIKDIIETCVEIISTGDAYNEVNRNLRDINPAYENVEIDSSAIDISQKNTAANTIYVTATTDDPQLSYDVCSAFEKMVQSRIPIAGRNVEVEKIDSAKFAEEPSSPNLLKNSVIGAVLGLVVSAVIVILVEMLDNTVKDGEEAARQCDILLLAEIPDIYDAKNQEKYYEYSSHGKGTHSSGRSGSSGTHSSSTHSSRTGSSAGGTKNGR